MESQQFTGKGPDPDAGLTFRAIAGPYVGQVFALRMPIIRVGRKKSNDIDLSKEIYAPRLVFELVWAPEKDTYLLRAYYGDRIAINGQIVSDRSETDLTEGGEVQVGETILRHERA